ncbi:MAG: hypothetical protein J1F33_02530 [Clostridiales bacterium]|nr:hypothetical protein [Clostridiales bacterium]
MKKLLFVAAAAALLVPTAACSQKTATQSGDVSPITKGYFSGLAAANSVTVNLDDYVQKNGTSVSYTASGDNDEIVGLTVNGSELTVTLNGGEGVATVTVNVNSDGKKAFTMSFSVSVFKCERVACIGDSLTYGHAWHNESYPVYLQELLGGGVEVKNFGVNGSAVTNRNESGYKLKYDTLKEYSDSIAFKPDIAVIMLGSNDGYNWNGAEPTFDAEYEKLVESYFTNGADRVVLLTAPPTLENNAFNISDDVLKTEVCPRQRQLSESLGTPLVDLREVLEALDDLGPLYRPGDGVHFSVEGAKKVASTVRDALIKL